jgi:hypothetical protein
MSIFHFDGSKEVEENSVFGTNRNEKIRIEQTLEAGDRLLKKAHMQAKEGFRLDHVNNEDLLRVCLYQQQQIDYLQAQVRQLQNKHITFGG